MPVESPIPPRAPRPARKQVRDAEATREQVLLAALAEFAEKGLHGARVDDIAARTATSKHMIYYYFGSKDGLYAAVLERAYRDFRKVESNVDYAALCPTEALSTLIGNTFDAHIRNPGAIRILMSENLDRGRHVGVTDHTPQRELVLATTGAILRRGVQQGLFRAGLDPLHIHLSISALSFYAVSNQYTFGAVFQVAFGDETFFERRRAEVIETVLARCLVPARPAANA
jgi:AcrR family transcriptional regulator